MIQEIQSKSALTPVKGPFPYKWDLNPYRGCSHGCTYCYALYSHQYLFPDEKNQKEFYKKIIIKTNITQLLEKKLKSRNWKREIINISGVTDAYQAIEKKYQLMPKILKVLIKYGNPITISTKSNLILRDIDLINELSKITLVNIASTITTADEEVRKKIEPDGSPTSVRFEMLKTIKEKTNASIGMHTMPILPWITDSKKNLEELMKKADEIKVDYVLTGMLNLRSQTYKNYMDFIKKHYPDLHESYLNLFNSKEERVKYRQKLYPMIDELKRKYNIKNNFEKRKKEKMHEEVKAEKLPFLE